MEPFERLQQARANAGFGSAREAAARFGWTYSTYASHENGARGIRLTALRKYARAFGVTVAWLMTGSDEIEMPAAIRVTTIPTVGEVAAGMWMEADAEFHDDSMVPADPRYPPEVQVALRIRGTSMNKVMVDGDYAVGVLFEAARPIRDRDIVAVRRFRGGLVETTVKRYRMENGAALLWPESDDPKYQKPIDPASSEDDATVEFFALVIGTYRPLP